MATLESVKYQVERSELLAKISDVQSVSRDIKSVNTETVANAAAIGVLQGQVTPLVPDHVYTARVLIPKDDVLTGFDTPVQIVAAPDAGFFILPVGPCIMKATFAGVAYDTNVNSFVGFAGEEIYDFTGTLGFAADIFTGASLVADPEFAEASALLWWVDTGNPETGDSDIEIIVSYKIVEIG